MTRTNITLTREQHEWLRQEAFKRRISMSELLRLILQKTMERDN